MTEFWDDYCKAESFVLRTELIPTKNKNRITRTQTYIEKILVPFLKKLKEAHPEATLEDFNKIIEDTSFDLAKTAFKSANALDYYMLHIANDYFQKNPEKCRKMYEDYQNGNLEFDEEKFIQSSDYTFENYLKRFMHYVAPSYTKSLKSFTDFLDDCPEMVELLKDPQKTKKYLKSLTDVLYKKHLEHFIKYYKEGITGFLPDQQEDIEKTIKNTLSISISEIAKQLKRLNLFEKYREIELKNYEKLGLKALAIASNKYDLTNKDLLKTLSIHDLMILNSFWINRYAKELNNYCNALFAMHNLDLISKVFDDSFDPLKVNSEHVIQALIKCNMLRYPTQLYMTEMSKKYMSKDYSPDEFTKVEGEDIVLYSFDPFGESLKNRYNFEHNNEVIDEYTSFFSSLPGNTTIEQDAVLYGKLFSPVVNIYDTKSEILNCLIFNLKNNKKISNAGIIPNKVLENRTQILLDPNYICIGIDGKFTSPVTEHIKLSVLRDFLRLLENSENAIVPLYEGHKDFTYPNGEYITVQRLIPSTPEIEKIIRKLNNDKSTHSSLTSHLAWNITDNSSKKIPDEFKSSITNSKGKKKSCHMRTYVDLSEFELNTPLQIYVFEDDKLIPIQDSNYTVSKLDSIISENGDGDYEH